MHSRSESDTEININFQICRKIKETDIFLSKNSQASSVAHTYRRATAFKHESNLGSISPTN